MPQILASQIKRGDVLLFQDLYFIKERTQIRSTVKEAACSICDKCLEDGVSVTAKKIGEQMRFFCQYHFSKDP